MPGDHNAPLPSRDGGETLEQLYRRGRKALSDRPGAEGDTPMEAALLFRSVFGLGRQELLLRGGEAASPDLAGAFWELVRRRLAGEPLQYLLGEWEFYGLPFRVGPGVLIPRPETELLVDAALKAVAGIPSPVVLDLCSGSGCVPVAIACRRPDARVTGVELSPEAFRYFRENASLNGAGNVTPLLGDAFALPPEVRGPFAAITANPPYIRRGELASLQAEVQREPVLALDGGEDGLDFYRRLPGLCLPLLAPGGVLLLEIGEDQGEAVAGLAAAAGFRQVEVRKDLSGLDRVVLGRR